MKKASIFLVVILLIISTFGCSQKTSGLTFVCPDGAPAISAYALKDVDGINFTVYSSSTAPKSITRAIRNKQADIAVLPINLASKLCNGNDYKAVGVLTHGNLYGISKDGVGIENIKGKKVGVIQLSAVPGFTVKLMLRKLGIEYTENESELTANNVYLFPLITDAQAVANTINSNKADLCVVAEPMCSNLIKKGFERTVDVQNEFGAFPQAVMVIKNSVLINEIDKVNEIISAFDGYDYTTINSTKLVDWINIKMESGADSSLVPTALSAQALLKSNIRYKSAIEQKQLIKKYLYELKIFDTELGTVAENVDDNFFWSGQ